MAVTVATRSSLALPSLLLYLTAYALTNLGAFAVVCALPRAKTIEDYRGLLRHKPWLAISLVVCLLGLVGTPPTAMFTGKLTVFTATLDGGYAWLVVVAAINTMASLFYHLRWITGALRPPPPPRRGEHPRVRLDADRPRPAGGEFDDRAPGAATDVHGLLTLAEPRPRWGRLVNRRGGENPAPDPVTLGKRCGLYARNAGSPGGKGRGACT